MKIKKGQKRKGIFLRFCLYNIIGQPIRNDSEMTFVGPIVHILRTFHSPVHCIFQKMLLNTKFFEENHTIHELCAYTNKTRIIWLCLKN